MKPELLAKHQYNFDYFSKLKVKHGVYVFTTDVCQICQDYKKEIADIDSTNLNFVECVLQKEKDAIYELTDHIGMPQTVIFKRNKIENVYMGKLFDNDLSLIAEQVAEFDANELNNKDIEDINNSCKPVIAIFPNDIDIDDRNVIKRNAIKKNLFLIDLPFEIDDNEIIRSLERILDYYDIVFFDLNTSSNFKSAEIAIYNRYKSNGKEIINENSKDFL